MVPINKQMKLLFYLIIQILYKSGGRFSMPEKYNRDEKNIYIIWFKII